MLQGLCLARTAAHIVPQVAGIGGHSRHSYGRVEHGTASQCEDKIASVFLGASGGFHYHLLGRVLVDIAANDISRTGFIELGGHAVKRAVRLYGPTAGYEQQSLSARKRLVAELVQFTTFEK